MSPAEQVGIRTLRAQVAIDRRARRRSQSTGAVNVSLPRYSHGVRETADIVEEAIARAVGSLIPRDALVLVACSGGADSVALAAALAGQRGVRVAIGHVDHGLRPESAREADAVRALAGSLGVPCFVERLGNLKVAEVGLEAAAREGRYAALARLAAGAGASVVATAHTRRDQAETLLLRLARGAGPGALAGVRVQRALAPGLTLVRPLLSVPRAATEALCHRRGLSFVNDPHNLDPARARARLRHGWALLSGLNPRLEEALAGAAGLLADEDDLVAGLARSPRSTPRCSAGACSSPPGPRACAPRSATWKPCASRCWPRASLSISPAAAPGSRRACCASSLPGGQPPPRGQPRWRSTARAATLGALAPCRSSGARWKAPSWISPAPPFPGPCGGIGPAIASAPAAGAPARSRISGSTCGCPVSAGPVSRSFKTRPASSFGSKAYGKATRAGEASRRPRPSW